MLPGDETQPSRQLASVREALRVTDGSHQGARRERSDSRNLRKPAARIVLSMPDLDLQLQLTYLPMKLPEVVPESLQQLTEYTR